MEVRLNKQKIKGKNVFNKGRFLKMHITMYVGTTSDTL